MAEPFYQRAFAAGELDPALTSRADLTKYALGLKTCRNFLVRRSGGVSFRPGTKFIATTKEAGLASQGDVRFLRYVSEEPGESVLIEFGELYLRFYQAGSQVQVTLASVSAYSGATNYVQGDLVKDGGIVYYAIRASLAQTPSTNPDDWYPFAQDPVTTNWIYEIPTVFDDPWGTNWVQSGRVITFTHADEQPHDLAFRDLTDWVIVPLVTEPGVTAPTGFGVATVAGAENWAYKVTAVAPGTYEESEPTAEVRDVSALAPSIAAPHLLTWNAVQVDGVNCPEYHVYCDQSGNGTFGYIGTATGQVNFQNPGITPDFAITPPVARSLFTTTNNFPRVCAYYQQRRWFGNTNNQPDGIWASRVGFPDNFGISSPLQDDDAITVKIAGNNHHPVRHLIALKDLIVMTDGGEWRLFSTSGSLTPSSIAFDQETYVGSDAAVRPVAIGNSILYMQARRTIMRELRFDQEVEGLAGKDLSIFAAHLLEEHTVESMDYQQNPDSIVWAVRSDGRLLGLTYLHEQDIWGWHRHDAAAPGQSESAAEPFIDVCVVPEATGDAVYVIVNRLTPATLTGDYRLIERLEFAENDDVHLDASLRYSGVAVTSVSGLDHLAGRDVGALVGGSAPPSTFITGTVNASGVLALGGSYTQVVAGLRFPGQVETLSLDTADSAVRARLKAAPGLQLLLKDSARTFDAGPTTALVVRYRPRADENPSTVFGFTGTVELPIRTSYTRDGRVLIEQNEPFPMTILGILPFLEVGG